MQPDAGPPPTEPPDEWVDVAAFPTRPFAEFVASALEGNGIPARVVGDDGGGMLMHLDTLSGGVRVQVRAEELEAASALLGSLEEGPPTEELGTDGTGPGTPPAASPAATSAPIAARTSSPWRTVLVLLVVIGLLLVVGAAFLDP